MGLKVLLLALAALVFFSGGEAWLFGSGGSGGDGDSDVYYYTHSAEELRRLYNAPVILAQRYERPLAIGVPTSIANSLNLKHSGVVVTLRNNQRFLVHKGNEYGIHSQTVVTEASVMSSVWDIASSRSVYSSTVGDYVRVGGTSYSLCCDNCHHASARMMNLP